MDARLGGLGLGELLLALDRTLLQLLAAPRGLDITVASVALIETDDLRRSFAVGTHLADAFFLVGVEEAATMSWLDALNSTAVVPAVIFGKGLADSSPVTLRSAELGIGVVSVHPQARWERLYSLIRRVLENRELRAVTPAADNGLLGSQTDLFGLAQTVATLTDALVSIEDEHSHVLAYSASEDEADELRRLSILGREGPPEHLEWIREWGIFDQLRNSDEVVEVAERAELALRPRLVVGIRQHLDPDPGGGGRLLGSIWLQQGSRPFAPDAARILHGASVFAERLMMRAIAAPSNEARQLEQLLGSPDASMDIPTIAASLGIADGGPAAVVGFAAADRIDDPAALTRATNSLTLHASSFRRDARVLTIGRRTYALFPQSGQATRIISWARHAVGTLEVQLGSAVRAAVAAPISSLHGVADARIEVDRVLDAAAHGTVSRVATMADARTTVLLSEIIEVVQRQPRLRDPRLQALIDYDRAHGADLVESLRRYLDAFGDVRSAAATLHVHPNTLRYRLRRAEQVSGLRLSDPAARLLLEIQLRLGPRP